MQQTKTLSILITMLLLFPVKSFAGHNVAQTNAVVHNSSTKKITLSNENKNLVLQIDYKDGCRIAELEIKGKNTLSSSGVYTGFRTKGGTFNSLVVKEAVKVEEQAGKITVKNIVYGDPSIRVNESWTFETSKDKIVWRIDREYSGLAKLEEMSFPQWNFNDLSVWKGGILDNGGMVWCKYLWDVNDTYGVHTGGVTFWNPDNGNAFRISAKAGDKYLATKYSQSEKQEFVCTHFVTDTELEPRYNLSRFVHQHSDVFTPFDVQRGITSVTLEMEYVDYDVAYSRGNLPGIDEKAVRELMNTTGRYGVVDNGIVGANGWTTNWKCLHEPFFSQIGMALGDENYTRNNGASLDRERDHAITPEGRVLSRWHNTDEDQMQGTFNYKTGYYEARWGYTVDSQTGQVINTAEQFDLCGDIHWLRSHKTACEKALDWLIRRDSNNNGIFEMMNNSIAEETASDWLDIVWATFENAFVNAQMYEALNLWADCERVLGDTEKASYYTKVAARLKENFNKPIDEGGFWSPENKQYVYWRDKDGSVHGDNLVTPVNFAVIAFNLCDDKKRIAQILDQIEKRTAAENLFHWPLCFDSYKREEVQSGNWPFPKYENGDIFPTWGYMGIRAYARYDKAIALKYVRNLLEQYKKDGLSSQRYSRETQLGLGSDILAGICTSVTALYRDIYGVRPKWNRMGLEPNMVKTLNGTTFNYTLRNTVYQVKLNVNDYELHSNNFSVKSKEAFGASFENKELALYPHNKERMIVKLKGQLDSPISVELNRYTGNNFSWKVTSADNYQFTLEGLNPARKYVLMAQGKTIDIKIGDNGKATFTHTCTKPTVFHLNEK
ncbi:alpha-L-rhamnosidase-related protein [Parabacteroides pacaensis]|uniref:alpha-L-rhamnosidase-related protein n=1 Tax=Parabacteroides pacaensis TaxID=2086575 RepID=UPI0018FE204F|nr:hypothetical protein [Parabacteroides pacaensis]